MGDKPVIGINKYYFRDTQNEFWTIDTPDRFGKMTPEEWYQDANNIQEDLDSSYPNGYILKYDYR